MATNVADVLNTERNKNPGIVANGGNIAAIINQGNSAVVASAQNLQTNVEELKKQQEEALAARQTAARVAFETVQKQDTALSEELAQLNVRTAQTKEAEAFLRATQNEKATAVAQATIEVNNSSFFKNPIAWFSSRSKLNDAKGDLQNTSKALIDVHNVIDQEYMVASRNYHDFQASKVMIAQRQAELDAKLAAEKEAADVQYASQKAQADTQSLQILATQMKINPLELKRQELALEEQFRDKANANAKDVYGVEALLAAHDLNPADPKIRLQVATAFERMTPEEKHKWNSVQLSLLKNNKPLNSDSVLQEFKARNDTDGYLKVLQASDPELHQEIMRGVQQTALVGEENTKKLAELKKTLLAENTTAPDSKKLTNAQVKAKAQEQLLGEIFNGGIESVLKAGTYETRQKIVTYASRMPAEILNGDSIAVWADQIEEFSPKVKEALKSPNTILAYNTGYSPDNKISALDPQASKVLAGVEKLVAMGISEEEATRAYSTILKKSVEGYARANPEVNKLMQRFKRFGVDIPLEMKVPAIDLNFSLFGGAELRAQGKQELDLFNPVELQNLLARAKKKEKAVKEIQYRTNVPTIPRF